MNIKDRLTKIHIADVNDAITSEIMGGSDFEAVARTYSYRSTQLYFHMMVRRGNTNKLDTVG